MPVKRFLVRLLHLNKNVLRFKIAIYPNSENPPV